MWHGQGLGFNCHWGHPNSVCTCGIATLWIKASNKGHLILCLGWIKYTLFYGKTAQLLLSEKQPNPWDDYIPNAVDFFYYYLIIVFVLPVFPFYAINNGDGVVKHLQKVCTYDQPH